MSRGRSGVQPGRRRIWIQPSLTRPSRNQRLRGRPPKGILIKERVGIPPLPGPLMGLQLGVELNGALEIHLANQCPQGGGRPQIPPCLTETAIKRPNTAILRANIA